MNGVTKKTKTHKAKFAESILLNKIIEVKTLLSVKK